MADPPSATSSSSSAVKFREEPSEDMALRSHNARLMPSDSRSARIWRRGVRALQDC